MVVFLNKIQKNWEFSIQYQFFNFMSKLTKPQFIKVQALADARNGYNVYAKIVKTEEVQSNDGLTTFVRAVIADETGAANAFFKGETADLIKEGAVIAIRNGKIRLIKNHISLEIDLFGRVTPENIQIKENAKENISDKQIEHKKRERGERRQPRDNEERPRRRRQDDERPRREDRPRREEGDRQPRKPRDNEDRPPRRPREDEDRPRRPRDNEDRPPRRPREDEDRPRRPREDNRGGERREGGDRDRKPREFDDRRGERRPPITWTKIGAIEPGDEDLSIIAKVVSTENIGRKVRLVLGDETGVVKGFMFNSESLVEGNSVVMFKAQAIVVKQHIEVQLMDRGRVEVARRDIRDVNKKVDVSAKEWVEAS